MPKNAQNMLVDFPPFALGLRTLIAIGFEAELSLEAGDYETGFWFHGLERLFLCIYCAEALFRAFSDLDAWVAGCCDLPSFPIDESSTIWGIYWKQTCL